jgi:hypothetical protein
MGSKCVWIKERIARHRYFMWSIAIIASRYRVPGNPNSQARPTFDYMQLPFPSHSPSSNSKLSSHQTP